MKTTANFTNRIKERTESSNPLTWTELDENFKFGNSWEVSETYKVGMIVWWNDFLGNPSNESGQMSQWLCKEEHISNELNAPGLNSIWERLTISQSESLNGTNYVMVYGVGTPEDNAAELQAAYDEAKTMPRYLGNFSNGTFYKGQTLYSQTDELYRLVLNDFTGLAETDGGNDAHLQNIAKEEAESVRTTVIVAPGIYGEDILTTLTFNANGIDIKSITGDSDVIIPQNVLISADFAHIKGLYVTKSIQGAGNANLVCENCTALGDYSFGYTGAKGTYISCKGANFSFGNEGEGASGIFINCTGGDESFGCTSNTACNGTFINCKAGGYSFCYDTNINGATFKNCEGGDYSFGHGADSFISGAIFENCKGGDHSFGWVDDSSVQFLNCKGGNYSFGYNGSTLGVFINCIGGDNSFGSGENGVCNGTFKNCIGGEFSFGAEGLVQGEFTNCVGSDNSFGGAGGTSDDARFYYCIGGVGSGISAANTRYFCIQDNTIVV